MAVIGARPAPTPWFGLRRGRPKPRTRPQRSRGSGRRMSSRIRTPADVRPMLVVILAAAALAFFYLSQSASVAATGYEIDSLEATLAARRAEQQQLILAIGRARSPAVIIDHAAEELHLVELEAGAVTFAPAPDHPAD
jgi:cell division protein FtsL